MFLNLKNNFSFTCVLNQITLGHWVIYRDILCKWNIITEMCKLNIFIYDLQQYLQFLRLIYFNSIYHITNV